MDTLGWIMLVAGALTCTMLYAAVAPARALNRTFGESLEGPVAEVVVRNWGILITLVGALLVFGAFRVEARPAALAVAGVSKAAFVLLMLTTGRRYAKKAGTMLAIDAIEAAIFLGALLL